MSRKGIIIFGLFLLMIGCIGFIVYHVVTPEFTAKYLAHDHNVSEIVIVKLTLARNTSLLLGLYFFIIGTTFVLFKNYIIHAVKRIDCFIQSKSLPVTLLIIFIASIIYRLLSVEYIEGGGDAFYKWNICREFIESGVWWPELMDRPHHQLRWALNFPVIAILFVFGTNTVIYYVYPILISSLTACFIYLILRKGSHSEVGLVGVCIYILLPVFIRPSSQFLPNGPQAAYLLVTFYFLLLWGERNKIHYIYLSAIFLFISYGCKITAFYYLPAIIFYIVWMEWRVQVRKRYWQIFKPALQFSLLIVLMLLLETVIIYAISGNIMGRLGIITNLMSGYYARSDELLVSSLKLTVSFEEWILGFNRYTGWGLWGFLLYTGLIASVSLLFISKTSTIKLLSISYISVFILYTYLVVSIVPLKLAHWLIPRYLESLYVLAVICTTILLYFVIPLIFKNWHVILRSAYSFAYMFLIVCMGSLFFLASVKFSTPEKITYHGLYALMRVNKLYQIAQEARHLNIPLAYEENTVRPGKFKHLYLTHDYQVASENYTGKVLYIKALHTRKVLYTEALVEARFAIMEKGDIKHL